LLLPSKCKALSSKPELKKKREEKERKGKTNRIMLVIPAPRRLKQEDQELEASLGYIVRHC
jgi:hypothetical protein